jgi:tRNA 5-methylaminomethyl-2-thiouridine biosynthesis bifunctional protein
MWSPRVMKGLARLSQPGTTLATWSTAAGVRDALEAAGFKLQKREGFGRKREMLTGTYAPRLTGTHASRLTGTHASRLAGPHASRLAGTYAPRLAGTYAPRAPARSRPAAPAEAAERHAVVIGAGLAGAAVTERLAQRGWRIDLIDERAASSADAQGFAGVFHPHLSPDDCIRSRVARNGYLYGLSRWRALERAGHALAWQRCGVLQLASDREQEERMRGTIAALGLPADYARYVGRHEAERLAASSLPSGGWWFPGSGWMRASTLIAAQLDAAGDALTRHFGTRVHAIRRPGERWEALDLHGRPIASAPVLVLANSSDIARFASFGQPLAKVRGQVTYVPASSVRAPRTVVTGRGYVLPAADGVVVTGSTYDNEEAREPNLRAHEANLMHLKRLLPDALQPVDAATLEGAVGFRCAAPDRMPLVGAVPDVEAARSAQADLAGAHLADLPRLPGLYCVTGFASRGLVWSSLAGEMIASALEGEPSPLESDLADALDPARFVLRQARRGRL